MAHSPRKNSYPEQLWNVSLLPTPAPRRCVQPEGPGPRDDASALRSAALLSVSESETIPLTAQAA